MRVGEAMEFPFHHRHHHHHEHRAVELAFRYTIGSYTIQGEYMSVTLSSNQQVSGSVIPLDAAGTTSPATISNVVFTSSDPTIFTIAADPTNTPAGFIITAIAAGSAEITSTALATETDGSTNTITGSDSVTVNAAVVPPVNPATALGFTYSAPVLQGAPAGPSAVKKVPVAGPVGPVPSLREQQGLK